MEKLSEDTMEAAFCKVVLHTLGYNLPFFGDDKPGGDNRSQQNTTTINKRIRFAPLDEVTQW
jgi:hypothetical protein